MIVTAKEIGTRIKYERERNGISESAFARLGGTHPAQQSHYEKGKVPITCDYLEMLLYNREIDILYIVTGIHFPAAGENLNKEQIQEIKDIRLPDNKEEWDIKQFFLHIIEPLVADSVSGLAARLKKFRKSLGLTEETFAEKIGINEREQINYEKDVRTPDALYLAKIATVGADIQYLVTGNSAESQPARTLAPDEIAVIDNYRNSSDEGRKAIEVAGVALAQRASMEKKEIA